MLADLGFDIISEGPARVVRKDGTIYREGTTPHGVTFNQNEIDGIGVYVIRVAGTEKYKIGIATDFRSRFRNLQTGSADELEPYCFYPTQKARELETFLHKKYKANCIGREWFRFTLLELHALHEYAVVFLKN